MLLLQLTEVGECIVILSFHVLAPSLRRLFRGNTNKNALSIVVDSTSPENT